jgi:hypothetical protein
MLGRLEVTIDNCFDSFCAYVCGRDFQPSKTVFEHFKTSDYKIQP